MNGEKKEKYVHEVFDTIAGKYDFMYVVMTWGDAEEMATHCHGQNRASPRW